MFPARSSIFVAPFTDAAQALEFSSGSNFWTQTDFFGIDLTCLKDDAVSDHFSRPVVGVFDPSILLSTSCSYDIDLKTVSAAELQHVRIPFSFTIDRAALLHGVAFWFDVTFDGNTETVKLDTGPWAPATHWQQMRMFFSKPLGVNRGQRVVGYVQLDAHSYQSHVVHVQAALEGTGIQTNGTYDLKNPVYASFYSQAQTNGYSMSYGTTPAMHNGQESFTS